MPRRTLNLMMVVVVAGLTGCSQGSWEWPTFGRSAPPPTRPVTSAPATPATGAPAGATQTRLASYRGRTSGGLVASSRTPVADIPVPVGFEMVEPISRNYQTSGSRIVDHTYRGKGDKLAVKNFYLKHLPVKGWTVRRLQMVRGIYRLNCEKGQETCDLTIDSLERTFGGYLTTVTAHIQPMAQGQIK